MRERGEATTDSPCPKTPTLIHSSLKMKLEVADLEPFLPFFSALGFATTKYCTLSALLQVRFTEDARIDSTGPKYVQAPTRPVFQ